MAGGWVGKVLRIDLSAGSAEPEDLDIQWARDYIGARGLGVRYLYEEVDPEVEPLSEDNRLYLATGPLTGTNASCGARYEAVTKSPLTGYVATSNSGGHWGPELKYAGYDMVAIQGAAESPVYLFVEDDRVEIRDASHLWGKGVWDTEDFLREELGVPDARILSIGPAGENLVRFAAILNDKHRAAGRSGVGAVMGSKMLKAIAVIGSRSVPLARPSEFMQATWDIKRMLEESPTIDQLYQYGTSMNAAMINSLGALPTRNLREAHFPAFEDKVNGQVQAEKRLVAKKACFACTIACGRVTELGEEGAGKWVIHTSPRNWSHAAEGTEYETMTFFTSDLGIDDLDAAIKANWFCNDYGMDTISAGGTIAAAMELFEEGAITEKEMGFPLPFGDPGAMLEALEQTAFREGFGTELAEGGKRLTEKFGKPDLFMGVKGQDFSAYEPRSLPGRALGYATSNRGACHLKEEMLTDDIMFPEADEGKVERTIASQHQNAIMDASGLCLFPAFYSGNEPLDIALSQLNAACGLDWENEDYLRCGERIWNLERLFNVGAGLTPSEDSLPKRMTMEPVPDGPAAGKKADLTAMLPIYYRKRGWGADGVPEPDKLAELGIVGRS
jgi:aldehyde:ferredoxin oxidoreductase